MVLVFMLFVVDPSNFDLRLLILSKNYLLKVFAKPLAEVWSGRGRSQFLCKT